MSRVGEGLLDYAVFQLERGEETGTPHFQGYLELPVRRRVGPLKVIMGAQSMHLELRRGTRDQARAYAMKAATRVEGPWEVGKWNAKLGEQGKRRDWELVKERLKAGDTVLQVLDERPEKIPNIGQIIRYKQMIYVDELKKETSSEEERRSLRSSRDEYRREQRWKRRRLSDSLALPSPSLALPSPEKEDKEDVLEAEVLDEEERREREEEERREKARFRRDLRRRFLRNKRRMPKVIVLIGPSDVGKSTFWIAQGLLPDSECWIPSECIRVSPYRKAPTTKWWDGYAGEPVIQLEDYGVGSTTPGEAGVLPWTEFLSVMEIPFHQVEKKGDHTLLVHKYLLFTTNKHPLMWYPGELQDENLRQALGKRIDHFLFVPSRRHVLEVSRQAAMTVPWTHITPQNLLSLWEVARPEDRVREVTLPDLEEPQSEESSVIVESNVRGGGPTITEVYFRPLITFLSFVLCYCLRSVGRLPRKRLRRRWRVNKLRLDPPRNGCC